MLAVYIITAIVGGVLILLSALGGAHDHGFDMGHHDVDIGHGADVGHDADIGHGADVGHGDVGHEGDLTQEAAGWTMPWMPFFSLRFWTYFCAVFGGVGVTMTYLGHASSLVTAIVAGGLGLSTGLLVAIVMRVLALTDSDSTTRPKDMLGTVAKVLVALRGEQPGRIRVTVKGDVVDMLALTQDGSTIEAGEDVVVVGIEGDRVTVVPRSEIFD